MKSHRVVLGFVVTICTSLFSFAHAQNAPSLGDSPEARRIAQQIKREQLPMQAILGGRSNPTAPAQPTAARIVPAVDAYLTEVNHVSQLVAAVLVADLPQQAPPRSGHVKPGTDESGTSDSEEAQKAPDPLRSSAGGSDDEITKTREELGQIHKQAKTLLDDARRKVTEVLKDVGGRSRIGDLSPIEAVKVRRDLLPAITQTEKATATLLENEPRIRAGIELLNSKRRNSVSVDEADKVETGKIKTELKGRSEVPVKSKDVLLGIFDTLEKALGTRIDRANGKRGDGKADEVNPTEATRRWANECFATLSYARLALQKIRGFIERGDAGIEEMSALETLINEILAQTMEFAEVTRDTTGVLVPKAEN